MTLLRAISALGLVAGLLCVAGGTAAQPPNLVPGQPKIVQKPKFTEVPADAPAKGGELPIVPKSSAAFLTLKVSEVMDHADLKPVLEQLKKNAGSLRRLD